MNQKNIIFASCIYLVIITLLSTLNISDSVPKVEFEHFDKFVHFCFYFGLNSLLLTVEIVRRRSYVRRFSRLSLITLASIIYGILIEIVQHYTGREFAWGDIIANSVGSVVALLILSRSVVTTLIQRYIR